MNSEKFDNRLNRVKAYLDQDEEETENTYIVREKTYKKSEPICITKRYYPHISLNINWSAVGIVLVYLILLSFVMNGVYKQGLDEFSTFFGFTVMFVLGCFGWKHSNK